MIKNKVTAALSLLIATVVVMSSLHVTQLASAAAIDKQTDPVKIHSELHNHIDKAGKIVGGDVAQIDARSLRLRDLKRSLKNNQLAHIFGSWRDHLSLLLS